MQLNSQSVSGPPRASASIVLLRDGPTGLEVFLMKRHGLSDVLGGAFVFPGGKVDAADATLDAAAHLDQPAEALLASLGEHALDAPAATGLYVAAVREAFEESGVLFAHDADATRAAALLREGHAFADVLALMVLRLRTRDLVPWSRWITPVVPSLQQKRFDTRFFVAALPEGQTALHDNRETTDSVWLAPRAALQQYWADQMALAPPQIMSLAHLSRHASVASVLAAARSRLPPVIQPEPQEFEGTRVVCYPGDPGHPLRERALPGPTRLIFRNRRFEPMEGFDALFR
ncbi:MAG: NUDIX hydrolase [Ramlibacter sp.]|nr:NUDIX hydrolase [Ramlibacter sp.]